MENKASVNGTSVDEVSVVDTIPSEPKRKIEWNTILAAISVLSVALGSVSTLIRYFGETLYLYFWGIPTDYSNTNNNSFIIELLLLIGFTLFLLLFSYGIKMMFELVQEVAKEIAQNGPLKVVKEVVQKAAQKATLKRTMFYIIHIIIFIIICGIVIMLLQPVLAFLSWALSDDSIYTFNIDPSVELFVMPFSIIFTGGAYCIGWKIFTAMQPYAGIKDFFNKKRRQILGVTVLVIVIVGCSMLIYRIGTCKNTTTFDIIDNQYVVLHKDSDTFIVKECCIHENNMIYIDMDTYRLIDAKNVEVQTIRLNPIGGGQAFERLSSEEYTAHLASKSPAHETSD